MYKKDINVYRRYAMAGATFSAAISIGFLMQQSEPGYAGQVVEQPAVAQVPSGVVKARLPREGVLPPEQQNDVAKLPHLPQDLPRRADLPMQPVVLLVSRDAPSAILPKEETAPLLNCDATLIAEPSAAAMVDLFLSAPCLAGERVTVHHGGLKFSEILGDDGSLSVSVPAFAEQASFVVAFANGDGAVARTEVSSLPFYDRVAVQWSGDTGLQIHAREFDAAYGSEGHVWYGAPRDVSAVAGGQGGFLTRLGNSSLAEPTMVEVYTFPTGTSGVEGQVAISLEAEVSATTCDREIAATAFELKSDGKAKVQDLTMTLPGCDAVGEFLVLKNLLEDLTIARK